MKYFILFLSLSLLVFSCSKKTSYSKVCHEQSKSRGGAVSGKKVTTKRVSKNTYRNYRRRPHKLGLLRK